MAARAMWKGTVKIGSTGMPVKLFAAVTDRTVHFHILDKRSHTPVKQRMEIADTGEEVPTENIQKAYEVEPGKFVIISKEDLESLEPAASRDIEITEFVSPGQISQQWYDRPYYLAPDGSVNEYFALAEALQNRERAGVAHWVMRKKAYFGVLRSQDGYLWLVTLRNAEEVILAADLPSLGTPAATKTERRLAKQLVETIQGEFNPSDYKDEYRDRVMEFIDKKATGKTPKLRALKRPSKQGPLEDALARSLKALKKEKRSA